MLQVDLVVSAPFEENSWILRLAGSKEAVVVDPGFNPDAIEAVLKQHDLKLVAILNTHGHVDHIAGNAQMKKWHPDAPLIIGEGDAPMLTDAMLNLSGGFGLPIVSPPADRLVKDGEMLDVAGVAWKVLEIPGHSPGHVVFYSEQWKMLIGGDVLFSGGIGRTDFPGGSLDQLLHGIRTKLWPLPDDVKVLPGHNETTTIGEEKRSNPFLS